MGIHTCAEEDRLLWHQKHREEGSGATCSTGKKRRGERRASGALLPPPHRDPRSLPHSHAPQQPALSARSTLQQAAGVSTPEASPASGTRLLRCGAMHLVSCWPRRPLDVAGGVGPRWPEVLPRSFPGRPDAAPGGISASAASDSPHSDASTVAGGWKPAAVAGGPVWMCGGGKGCRPCPRRSEAALGRLGRCAAGSWTPAEWLSGRPAGSFGPGDRLVWGVEQGGDMLHSQLTSSRRCFLCVQAADHLTGAWGLSSTGEDRAGRVELPTAMARSKTHPIASDAALRAVVVAALGTAVETDGAPAGGLS